MVRQRLPFIWLQRCRSRGGIAGFIDAEHALDPVYAKNIGVDIDDLYISQPDSGEQALEITETMVRSGAMDIVDRRFRSGSCSEGGDRWRYGRFTRWSAGKTDVPGIAKTDACNQQVQLCRDLYQPAA